MYFQVLGTFVLLSIIYCPQPITAALRCSSCQSDVIKECDRNTMCGHGESCYSQLVEIESSVLPTFNLYDNGCIDTDRCDHVKTQLLHSGGSFIEHRKLLCGDCCTGDRCNIHLCGSNTTGQTSTPTVTSVTTPKQHTQLQMQCNQCTRPWSKDDCNDVTTCADGEICYAQVTETRIFFGTTTQYHSGCVQEQYCAHVNERYIENDGLLGHENVICGDCCKGGDECNKFICDIHKKGTSTCAACSTGAKSKDQCNRIATCSEGEVCYTLVAEAAVSGFFFSNSYETHYDSGCIQEHKCSNVKNFILTDTSYRTTPPCGGCCNGTECNRYLCGIHQKATTTTTATTQSTTITSTQVPAFTYTTAALTSTTTVTATTTTSASATTITATTTTQSQTTTSASSTVTIPTTTISTATSVRTHLVHQTQTYTTATTAKPTTTMSTTTATTTIPSTAATTPSPHITTTVTTVTTTEKTLQTTASPTVKETTIEPIIVDACMKCSHDHVGWNCSLTEKCGHEEVCFVQEIAVPSLEQEYYHGGCINISQCLIIGHTNVIDEGETAIVKQGQCCYTHNCNKQLMSKFEADTTVAVIDTISSATRTTKNPTSDTAMTITETTTSKTQTIGRPIDTTSTVTDNTISNTQTTGRPIDTTSTVTDTTMSTIQTTGISPLSCVLCDGGLCGLIPGLDPVDLCTVDEPYCMNIIDNDASGRKTYTKRCSSETDCNTKWWKESSDNTECTEFDPMIPYTFPFTCSFCCVTDNCNEDIYPKQNTLFQGTV